MASTKKTARGAFIAVTSLFFMWGFITVLADGLIPRLKDLFELKHWQAATVQIAWFVPYGLLSIPAGFLLARIGYKRGIVAGLSLAAVGCVLFFPAADFRVFGWFLTAIFVLGSGITILQVAANPYITVLGPSEDAARRLNLAQAFNSFGTTIAPIFSATFLLGDHILSSNEQAALSQEALTTYLDTEAAAVQTPFISLALAFALLAGVFALVNLPSIIGGGSTSRHQFREVWSNARLRFGALAIFVYVGAEVAIGSFLALYFVDLGLPEAIRGNATLMSLVEGISQTFAGKSAATLDDTGLVASFAIFYWGSAMIGRFVGAALLTKMRPGWLLSIFGTGAVLLLIATASTTGFVAMVSVLLVGFFNSVMFPTIFSMSLEELGEYKPEGSGILCTAIVGGAVIPPLVGYMRDLTGDYAIAFLLPLLCYLVIIAFARRYAR
jgi:FHS family L-fucose permease-like MFS transporter